MKKIVNYLRLHYPLFYVKMIFITRLLSRKNETIHVLDTYGGSFKDYVCENNMPEKMETLKKGLDSYSEKTVDIVFKRILNYPEKSYCVKIKNDYKNVIGGLLEEEQIENRNRVNKALKKISRELNYSRHLMDASVFYYLHGIKYLPEAVSTYLGNSHFLDLGAFSGDSAVALKQYKYSKIFSVEMSNKAIENYRVTMNKNGIDENKFEIIQAAITENDKDTPIYFYDNVYTVFSDKLTTKENAKISVPQRSVDSIVAQYKIAPRLIKADIEGSGLDCVKGAVKTLTTNRPVLSLAIYHNPFEFFETKPFLESILDNYTFLIRKMAIIPFGLRCHAETILLAYPNEILEN